MGSELGNNLLWDKGAARRRGTCREKRKVRIRAVGMLGGSFIFGLVLPSVGMRLTAMK